MLFAQLCRGLDICYEHEITPTSASYIGDAFIRYSKIITRLGALGNGEYIGTFKRGNVYLPTETR